MKAENNSRVFEEVVAPPLLVDEDKHDRATGSDALPGSHQTLFCRASSVIASSLLLANTTTTLLSPHRYVPDEIKP